MNSMWKIAPALACGCTIVMKPASETPLTALLLGELALEAGMPPGVLNILPGPGIDRRHVAGDAIPTSTRFRSPVRPASARLIMEDAAPFVTRLTLELGGKSPNLIFEDADIDAAVKGSSRRYFLQQRPGLLGRFAHPRARERSTTSSARGWSRGRRRSKIGDPQDEKTYMGPVISQKQMNSIMGYIEAGKSEGATLAIGRRARRYKGLLPRADGIHRRR